MKQNVLVINCGSSSLKFAVVDGRSGEQAISGLAERLSSPDAQLHWNRTDDSATLPMPDGDHAVAMQEIIEVLNEQKLLDEPLAAVGHRVVHGGETFTASTRIDDDVLAAIESCNHLAPLHNPANVLGIQTAREYFPDVPQVAVFDTSFHQTLPPHAYVYAVPYDLYTDHGVRRYGFHGTSHRYVTQRAAELLEKPYAECALLSAHLGNGCSAAAVLDGRSLDTTMGLTPLEGLVMGTRSGDVDPSLHAFLAHQRGDSLSGITNMLNKKSGLLGVSGLSNDMRTLLAAAEEGHGRAALAIDIFCYRLAKSLAGLAVALGRIDALIFTGGIGEHAAAVRTKVLGHLALLNFEIDPQQNAQHGRENRGIITQPHTPIAMVVPTDEERMIAEDCATLISSGN